MANDTAEKLPNGYSYEFHRDGEQQVHVFIKEVENEDAALKWIDKLQLKNQETWRISKTERDGKINSFKQFRHCQHAANKNVKGVRTSKSTGCTATLQITVHRHLPKSKSRIKDRIRKEWPTVVTFRSRHNHSTSSAAVLKRRGMSSSTRQHLCDLFQQEAMSSKNKCKVIIDCDPGADDAQAILMALNADHIDIVAITTVFGNAKIENTYLNVLRLLKFCHRSDISVYKGCDRNLIMEQSECGVYFGEDGFGDVIIPDVDPVDCSKNPTEHASVALCRLVSENPGEITLIALGCLTNIAVCLKLDPDFGKKLKDCVIMGGNNQAKGDLAPAVEFNFGKDPESARAVLEGLSMLHPYLFTYEVCTEYAASWEWYARYTSCGTKLSKLMQDIDRTAVMSLRERKSLRYLLYDQFAIGAIIDPSIMEEVKEVYADVELRGEISRGLVVIDWDGKLGKCPNVRLVTRINDEKCKHMMMESVKKF